MTQSTSENRNQPATALCVHCRCQIPVNLEGCMVFHKREQNTRYEKVPLQKCPGSGLKVR